jgi:hypothetical protein
VIIFASVVLSLVFAAFAITIQVQNERKRALEASLNQKARRLRWDSDDSEAVPPEIEEKGYHLFLSHVWSTGQDQVGNTQVGRRH